MIKIRRKEFRKIYTFNKNWEKEFKKKQKIEICSRDLREYLKFFFF